MSTELVTAHAGSNHVKSSDIGALYAGALGSGRYALDVGEGLAATMSDANTLHIGTGGFIFDGRWVRVTDDGEDIKIANGSQGAYRKDLVTYVYTRDPSSSNIETGEWKVVQGAAASKESDAKVPSIDGSSILDYPLTAACAVAEVDLSGLTPTAKLLLPSVASLRGLGDSVSQQSSTLSSLTAYGSGRAANTDQVDSSSDVTWEKVGPAVRFRFWIKFKYNQGSYDTTPALATGMPRPRADTGHCGVGLIDDKDGCVLAAVTAAGELKVVRRSAAVDAGGIVCGFGSYLAAS